MSIPSAALKPQATGRFQDVFQGPAVRQLFFLFPIGVAYATLLLLEPHRNLWFDELVTYYVTKAPSWTQLFDLAHRFDLNPMPMVFVLRRLSMAIFGDNEIAVRAPSISAGLDASTVTPLVQSFIPLCDRSTAICALVYVLLVAPTVLGYCE